MRIIASSPTDISRKNGLVTDAITYRTFGETTAHEVKTGGAAVYLVDYVRDKIGRITKKTETIQGAARVYEYAYAAAGRLAEVKEDGVVVSTYTYDANSNRTSAVTSSGSFAATYDAQDRMLTYGGAKYTYTPPMVSC